MNKNLFKRFGEEELSKEIKYEILSKVVKKTYDDSPLGASCDYLPINDYYISVIEKILMDEEADGFQVFINEAHFTDQIWDEENTGLIEIGKDLGENSSLHILVQTNLDYNFLGNITNPNVINRLSIGDEPYLEGIYYKVTDIQKSELNIKGVQYYDIILKPLFLKTLEEKNKEIQLVIESKERIIIPGQVYKHFKGNYYKIICFGKETETGEDKVVYQALYGDKQIYPICFEKTPPSI